ncbi:MAG: hypothetical protein LBV63_03930 [Candidatus Methanoplasma sp.]|jgi:flagellar basal body-associated protein FliL|nr:hypothetical protein [Candidatus Methanoplasma sp.]
MSEDHRISTKGSAIGILLLAIAAVAIVVAVALNPWIWESLLYVIVVAAAIIVIAIVIFILAAALLALPYYAAKGEQYQTGASYDLDDIESVKETDSEDR